MLITLAIEAVGSIMQDLTSRSMWRKEGFLMYLLTGHPERCRERKIHRHS